VWYGMCACKHVCMSVRTKESEYQAAVLAIGAETWTLQANNVRYLTIFHYYCVKYLISRNIFHSIVSD